MKLTPCITLSPGRSAGFTLVACGFRNGALLVTFAPATL